MEEPDKTSQSKQRQRISITTFGLACLCFLLPFCVLTCGNDRIDEKTYSGIDMMLLRFGNENPGFGGYADIFTILAFVMIIGGLILSIFKGNYIWRSISGSAAVVCLMILYVYVRDQIKYSSHEMANFIEVKFRIGYFLALFFALVGAILNFRYDREEKAEKKKAGT